MAAKGQVVKDSHFASGIVWWVEDGEDVGLVVDYYKTEKDWVEKRNAQIKFPGGTDKEFPGEPLLATLHREFVGETGLVLPSSPREIWVSDPRPDRVRGGVHVQHFFMCHRDECGGTLRTQVICDNGDWLSPPYPMSLVELCRVIFHSHKPALMAALEHLPS